jgi:hypothetical protein
VDLETDVVCEGSLKQEVSRDPNTVLKLPMRLQWGNYAAVALSTQIHARKKECSHRHS